jgi:hypothetical protein
VVSAAALRRESLVQTVLAGKNHRSVGTDESRALARSYHRRRRVNGGASIAIGPGIPEGASSLARPRAESHATAPVTDPGAADAVLLIASDVDPAAIAGLCESARALLADAGIDVIACDVSALVGPDMRTVDALARLTLVCRHLGGRVVLIDATPELRELLGLAGLAVVIPCVGGSALEPRR